ncbi:MAG: hypothetical protein HYZ26_07500 [Chloroflexi bacterium]|nr:hypothetical protein [Chloroflexota bacterium]
MLPVDKFVVLLLVSFSIFWSIGIVVLVSNPRSTTNRAFSAFLISTTLNYHFLPLFVLNSAIADVSQIPHAMYAKHALGGWIMATFFHFTSTYFPIPWKKRVLYVQRFLYILAVFYTFAAYYPGLVIKGVFYRPTLYTIGQVPGPFLKFMIVLFGILMPFVLYGLTRGYLYYRKTLFEPQVKGVWLSTLLLLFAGGFSSLIIYTQDRSSFRPEFIVVSLLLVGILYARAVLLHGHYVGRLFPRRHYGVIAAALAAILGISWLSFNLDLRFAALVDVQFPVFSLLLMLTIGALSIMLFLMRRERIRQWQPVEHPARHLETVRNSKQVQGILSSLVEEMKRQMGLGAVGLYVKDPDEGYTLEAVSGSGLSDILYLPELNLNFPLDVSSVSPDMAGGEEFQRLDNTLPVLVAGKPFGFIGVRHRGSRRIMDDRELSAARAFVQNIEDALDLDMTSDRLARSTGRLPGEDEAASNVLRINTLGNFELVRGDQRLTLGNLRSERGQQVLGILLWKMPYGIDRDALIELIWREQGQQQGRNNLYVAIHHLRRFLDGVAGMEPDDSLIVLERGRYSINREVSLQTDVAEFVAAVQSSDGDALARAIRLYRGDYLADFQGTLPADYEMTRFHYERLYLDGLRRCMSEASSEGEKVLYCRKYLGVEPLANDIWEMLVTTLAVSAGASAARAAIVEWQDVLKQNDIVVSVAMRKFWAFYDRQPR